MVGHQHVGVYGAAVSACGIAQFVEVARAVDGREETGAAIVAALHEVLRHAGQVNAWLSWHGVVRVLTKGP
ncbi:MAG: hypothetical protein ABS96_23125 [Lysobacteraceae bacterium SCN 69-123]|nr:MAG: hypothetical protein ABS96_23125 [Xanthomonadaceae bacterium SCN 69-123]